MRKQPGVVIVARHGSRIDQANNGWQTSAARPYDTPLTYGGWIQCQNLGLRIATELEPIDTEVRPSAKDTNDDPLFEPPRKRRKIIIHSSPYLRCIQTSIAISAGMKQFQRPTRQSLRNTQRDSSSKPESTKAEAETEVGEDNEKLKADRNNIYEQQRFFSLEQVKPLLRIDPFLGEWQSPSYFEHSTPPPPSDEMMSVAKEGLRVPAEEIKGADLSSIPMEEFSSTEWDERKPQTNDSLVHEKTGLRAMAAAGHSSLPRRPRNISFESESTSSNKSRPHNTSIRLQRPQIYSPPIPNYSIAPQDFIPIGFVGHARDFCIDIDYDWNSMDSPLKWGDGGVFGEEWSAMHRRFRNGLQKMMTYYELQGEELESLNIAEEDDEEELVLILVTHQAGCNALIRLMTGAPALHDVGTASLTMAVRKDELKRLPSTSSTSPTRRRGSVDFGFAQDFEMKIIASTEHLRKGSNPLGLNSPRLGKSPAFASRRTVGADSIEGFSIGDPLSWRPTSGHGGVGRSTSMRSHTVSSGPTTSSGLWERNKSWELEEEVTAVSIEPESNPNSTITKVNGVGTDKDTGIDDQTNIEITNSNTNLPVRSASHRGLWGGDPSIRRERSPGKRRWTAIDGPV